MTPRDAATEAQVAAARPDASTWLTANAGSGKTRVLTDRVARLLLDGVSPQNILCLTYTKAAAAEMQNRLFRRLGAWAMMADAELRAELDQLGAGTDFGATGLRDARTLFARAIETPGGLKIQTIHSFCAALLRRFPLEARVSPQFTEIEDRAADLLRAEIVDTMADGPDAPLLSALALHTSGDDFDTLTREIVQHRSGFEAPLDIAGALTLFGQPTDLDARRIAAQVFAGGEQEIIETILPVMRASGATDQKDADRLAALLPLSDEKIPGLEQIFLYGSGANAFAAKTGGTSRPMPTKSARKTLSTTEPALDAFMQRVEVARAARLALAAAQKTAALHAFSARFLRHYEIAKTLRGWLDFDDLIDRARALLGDARVAAWVLFRLDGGIDHILVDEAQDTSPAQWDVIRKLAAEFTSGASASETPRTIFVVGDKKQSIYSFQGADPRKFDEMQAEFRERSQAVRQRFQDRTLRFSFRSARAVLGVVDSVFADQQDAGFPNDAQHEAFKSDLPGRVDLWPWEHSSTPPDPVPWYTPLDVESPAHHSVLLAKRVAEQIRWMIDSSQSIPDEIDNKLVRRPVRAGDFLILVQRRGPLFAEIIRACKVAELDIAGADRLKVGGELAVRDLAALLTFLAVPEDSLSLASALRSPIFGWSEQKLFDLAHRRGEEQTLWQALRARADAYPEEMAILRDLRNRTDFLRPYDLIERILTRHDARRRILARLGAEAEDGINALLSQALAYERNAVPSLTGFLVWMETDDLEIKRQIDSASDQIRVMTVHGAKGLEAPIVILPDSGKREVRIRDEILTLGDVPVQKVPTDEMPQSMQDIYDARKAAEVQERMRLFYVAMTRAEKWLIVAAGGDVPRDEQTWYHMVAGALDRPEAETVTENGLAITRLLSGDWQGLPEHAPAPIPAHTEEIAAFYRTPADPPPAARETVQPSDLGGAKALPGDSGRDEAAAKVYGTLVHRHLEHLSAAKPGDWPAIAKTLAQDQPDAAEAFREARRCLETPALAAVFGPDSLSEIAVSADFGHARLHGTIDRLVISGDRVLAVDFKTNRSVPPSPDACPDGILRQMGAYAHALSQIYPDRRIETAIVWTYTGELMPLPHEIVMPALKATPYLDDSSASS